MGEHSQTNERKIKMKKILSVFLFLAICLTFTGCNNRKETAITTISPLSNDEKEIMRTEELNSIQGRVTGIPYSNVLELRSDIPGWENIWGKKVYIITDRAADFCTGDYIQVSYTEYERPQDNTKPIRITAKDIIYINLSECYKPIIYFYPQAPTVCSVKFNLNGHLTCTYPEYKINGWDGFTAHPDGTLVFPDGKEYYALYWEGIQNVDWNLTEGFCVRGEDTAEFLEWALSAQGLTRRELNEFIIYWLPLMQGNPFNVISFQNEAYSSGAVLDISPAPDSVLRVFMVYYQSETEVEIDPQSFKPFDRRGFTVVEWGGSQIK